MAIYGDAAGASRQSPRRPEGSRSARTRARALVFMIVALAAGLSSAWLVTRYLARHSGTIMAVPVSKVVVAASDIPVTGALTPDLLKIVDWPSTAKPQGSFDRVDALAGRVSNATIVAGEPIVEARLSPKGSGAGLASLIPADMRAMAVPVNEVVGVGGFIHPGDMVDVITTMQGPTPPGGTANPVESYRSRIVLQNIRVLAVGQQLSAENNEPKTVPQVTLLVTPVESERLALASTQGKLSLTMRSPIDKGEADTVGVSPPELLGSGRPATPPPPAMGAAPHPPAARPALEPPPQPPPAASNPVEVVEVFHGDRIEQRKVSPKVAQ